jgi:Glycosyl hydrolases family 32 N-terminal domain
MTRRDVIVSPRLRGPRRNLSSQWAPVLCLVIAAALLATCVVLAIIGPRGASGGMPASELGERGRATFATASERSVPPTPAKTNFGKVGVVLPNGTFGEADSVHARAPFVLRDDDGTYKMWYMGYDGDRFRMLFATSPDGIHWAKHGVMMDVGVPPYYWDSVGGQSVLKIGSVYHMWFCAGFWSGGPFGFWAQIYHAVSTDGLSWNVTGVALPPNQVWDQGMTNAPWVVQDRSGLYWLYFSGWDGSNTRLGVATSVDGLSFTPYSGNPILDLGSSGSWDQSDVNTPAVIPGPPWLLFYGGTDRITGALGIARSNDGFHWSKSPRNPVFKPDPAPAFDSSMLAYPDWLADPSGPRIYYAGGDGRTIQIGLIKTTTVKQDQSVSVRLDDTPRIAPLGTVGTINGAVLVLTLLVGGRSSKTHSAPRAQEKSRIRPPGPP